MLLYGIEIMLLFLGLRALLKNNSKKEDEGMGRKHGKNKEKKEQNNRQKDDTDKIFILPENSILPQEISSEVPVAIEEQVGQRKTYTVQTVFEENEDLFVPDPVDIPEQQTPSQSN